jgi:hypothetical protein
MKSKEASKKVSILRERVQKALWFAKSFGVQLTEIKGADKNGKIYERKTKHKTYTYKWVWYGPYPKDYLFSIIKQRPSWSWSYGSWIYNYLHGRRRTIRLFCDRFFHELIMKIWDIFYKCEKCLHIIQDFYNIL